LHDWQVSTDEARRIQTDLSARVSRNGKVSHPRFIAGVDIAVNKRGEMATAAVVLLSYPSLCLKDVSVVRGTLGMPYIPGLLSFREAPLILEACKKLAVAPDLIMVDGQGIAHPRRLGLASHLGLFLDMPAVGCAKSRLCGIHEEPGVMPGDYAVLTDQGEVIGTVLRTRRGVKPLYVSIGHRICLEDAQQWVLACCRGYRLPEPTRLAHQAAGGTLEPAATMPHVNK